MNDDLNAEKLSEIQARLEELESEISQSSESEDTSTADFFDQVDGERQTIVHWLEDVDASTVVSIGTAKEKFIEFSESRAEEVTDHQVSHGDVLVIGGDCPWYAVCAKVDRGVGGGDAGFQAEDPMDVAGTELENDEAYKEFIVWGGCDKIEALESAVSQISETVTEIGCPPGSGATVAIGSVSNSPGATSQVARPLEMVSIGSSVNTELNKLKALSISRDSQSSSPTEDFFAFSSLAAHAPQASSPCDPACGLWMTVKKFSSKTEEYKIESTVSPVTMSVTPVSLSEKIINRTQNTLTLSSATLSSNNCGSLSLSGSSTSLALLDSTASVSSGNKVGLSKVSISTGDDLTISLGTLELVTGFQSSSVSMGASWSASEINIFLPTLPEDVCPKTGEYTLAGSKVDIQVSLGECESVASLGGSLNQKVRIYTQPYGRDVGFECGIATKIDDETLGGTTQTHAEFWQPCVVSLGCDAYGSGSTHTISDSRVSISTVSLSNEVQHSIQEFVRDTTVSLNACNEILNITTGSWSSTGSPSIITVPIVEAEDCSGSGTPYTFEDYKVSLSSTVSLHTISPLSRTNTVSTNACGEITNITSGSWSSNGSPMQIAIPEDVEAEDCNGSPQTATLTDNRVSISTSSVSLGTLLTWTPLKRESVVTFDSCGKYVSLSSGNWAASSEFSASSVTIPDSSSTSTEECSEDVNDLLYSYFEENKIEPTGTASSGIGLQKKKRENRNVYNSCGKFLRREWKSRESFQTEWLSSASGPGVSYWYDDGSVVSITSAYSEEDITICDPAVTGSSGTKVIKVRDYT